MAQRQGKTEEIDKTDKTDKTKAEVLKWLDKLGLEWYEASQTGNRVEKEFLQTKIFTVLFNDFFHEDEKRENKKGKEYKENELLNATGEFFLCDLDKFKPVIDEKETRFSSFLLSRLNYTKKDIWREDYEIKKNDDYPLRLDEIDAKNKESGEGGSVLVKTGEKNNLKNPMDIYIDDESMYEMLMLIAKLQESLKGRQNNEAKKNYFRLFSTEYITYGVRISHGNSAIKKHERDIFDALKKSFLDYYMREKCNTIEEIEHSEMKRHDEVEEGSTDQSEVEIPFSNKLYITYLDIIENNKIKDSAISMQHTSYKELLGELLKKR